MNSIEATLKQSEFVRRPHLAIAIDRTPLDAMIAARCPNHQLNGLVPTLLDWLNDDREREIVWQRISPTCDARSVAPILMCPDDLDFWCSIVVADISSNSDTVCWHRLGLDRSTPEELPDGIGSSVEWFDGIGPFEFEKLDYSQMLEEFRRSHTPKNVA